MRILFTSGLQLYSPTTVNVIQEYHFKNLLKLTAYCLTKDLHLLPIIIEILAQGAFVGFFDRELICSLRFTPACSF